MKKPALFGSYLLLERVNVGGMAEVFAAKSFGAESPEQVLAIKKILPTMAEDQDFITMFIDEAKISAQLTHANVVSIHDFGKFEDSYFLAMDYVSGKDLRAVLERFRRRRELMPTAMAVFIATRVCEGLDYAHRKKDGRGQPLAIIHRDVSPQNVLLSYQGEVKIIDFGIAKAANRTQRTQAGILKGKFAYMSPEMVRGQDIDRRSDVFALGVVLYELVTGEKLFVGDSDYSTLERVREAQVTSPRQFNPQLSPALERVILKALAREPADRYQWASELQEDLTPFLLDGDGPYASRHLAAFLQDAFADDLEREAERLAHYASAERPTEAEDPGAVPSPSAGVPRLPPAAPEPALAARARTPAQASPSSVGGAGAVWPPRNVAISRPPALPGGLAALDDSFDRTVLVGGEPALAAPASPRGTWAQPSSEVPAPDVTGFRRPLPPGDPFLGALDRTLPPGTLRPPLGLGELPGSEPTVEAASPFSREETQLLTAEPPAATPPSPPRGPRLASGSRAQATAGFEAQAADEATGPDGAPAPAGELAESRVRSDAEAHARRGRRLLQAILAVSALALVALGALVVELRQPRSGLLPSATPRLAFSATVSPGALTFNEASRQVDLEPGEYLVQAQAAEPGHAPVRIAVNVKPGEYVPLALEFPLERPPDPPPPPPPAAALEPASWSAVLVAGEPGVEVLVEGRTVGVTPRVVVPDLVPGRSYPVQARKAGFEILTFTLENPDRRETLEVPLTLVRHRAPVPRAPAGRTLGKVVCTTTPPGAEVLVDGRSTGKTTPISRAQAIELPLGMHTVVFRLGGQLSPMRSFTLGSQHRGAPLVIDATLR